jgi:hypothetical protein
VVAKQWDDLTGMTLGFVGHPSINNSGRIVYEATLCPNMSCFASAIFLDRIELLRTPLSDGFVELTGLSDPVINDVGVIALYGYAFLADTSAVYLLPNNGPLVRIVHTGESFGPAIVLDNPRGILQGLDLNEHGDIATCWNTEAADWVVLRNAELVARAGDIVDGITLTEVQNHRPAINDDGTVAFIARYAEGFGVFTQTDAVLREGQTVGSETIRFFIGLAINDSGVIAAHVDFESGFYGIVLATPLATNHYVEMQTGSSVALRQTVDVPADPFAVRFDHRFATNTGQLNVRFGGDFLGSVAAPDTVGETLQRVAFDVSGELLGQSDAVLELEFDGPTGSTLELDNVFLPGLVNGTFESGSLAGWEAVTSGGGSVEVVPEPSATLASLICLGVLGGLRWIAPRLVARSPRPKMVLPGNSPTSATSSVKLQIQPEILPSSA